MRFKEVLRIWGEYAFLAGKGRDGGAFWENMCLLRRAAGSTYAKANGSIEDEWFLRRTDWGRIVLGQGRLGQRRRGIRDRVAGYYVTSSCRILLPKDAHRPSDLSPSSAPQLRAGRRQEWVHPQPSPQPGGQPLSLEVEE